MKKYYSVILSNLGFINTVKKIQFQAKIKAARTGITLVICISLLFSVTSCMVFVSGPSGKGMNSNNPHHPNTTNPGHTKGR